MNEIKLPNSRIRFEGIGPPIPSDETDFILPRPVWLIHEDGIIAYCHPRLMEWVAAGRPPAATYFTSGLLRFIAGFVEEQLAAQAREAEAMQRGIEGADGEDKPR